MADLISEFVGIKSPNPFWLDSAPPPDKEYNVPRAFEAGWGGVVWKTLGVDPPVVNVNGVASLPKTEVTKSVGDSPWKNTR